MTNQTKQVRELRDRGRCKPGAAILIGHVLLLLFELAVVVHGFADEGLATLRFYTTDSNLLCASLRRSIFGPIPGRKCERERGRAALVAPLYCDKLPACDFHGGITGTRPGERFCT